MDTEYHNKMLGASIEEARGGLGMAMKLYYEAADNAESEEVARAAYMAAEYLEQMEMNGDYEDM